MFIIKNIYAVTSFIREMYTEIANLKKYYAEKPKLTSRQTMKVSPGAKPEEVPMGYAVKPVMNGSGENGRL